MILQETWYQESTWWFVCSAQSRLLFTVSCQGKHEAIITCLTFFKITTIGWEPVSIIYYPRAGSSFKLIDTFLPSIFVILSHGQEERTAHVFIWLLSANHRCVLWPDDQWESSIFCSTQFMSHPVLSNLGNLRSVLLSSKDLSENNSFVGVILSNISRSYVNSLKLFFKRRFSISGTSARHSLLYWSSMTEVRSLIVL